MENELCHHGIKGMKWGVRRTPEQLGHHKTITKKKSSPSKVSKKEAKKKETSEKEAEKIQNRREKILSSPTALYRHRNEFTKQEIQDAMQRFQMERTLRDLSSNELNVGKRYIDTIVGYTESGIKAYNSVARIYNTINKNSDSQMRYVPNAGQKDKKKGNKKDEDDD